MAHIILTEQQVRVVVEAGGAVEVRDAENRLFASLTPLCPEELKPGPRALRNGGQPAPDAVPASTLPPMKVSPNAPSDASLELRWSKSRQKIRAAAREYSEQTHADY
jgi:hypothetical protein